MSSPTSPDSPTKAPDGGGSGSAADFFADSVSSSAATTTTTQAVVHPASERDDGTTAKTAAPANVSIVINPMEDGSPQHVRGATAVTATNGNEVEVASRGSPDGDGTESPGTSQMSPPPSYHDIPGTVPVHQGVSRGPPPSYQDAVDPNAEPPSYDSLFGRIRDTHKASRNFVDFLVRLLILLLGTIGCTIACSITIVIPVCMIVVGSIYFDECPAAPMIPVFLIVGGEILHNLRLFGT